MSTLDVPGVPFPLTPSAQSTWEVDATDGHVSVIALPHSDIFVAPGGGESAINSVTNLNAATVLAEAPAGDFQFTAQVGVDFASAFDAGVLLLWLNERYWAKLCFEYSPGEEPIIVSVVNRESPTTQTASSSTDAWCGYGFLESTTSTPTTPPSTASPGSWSVPSYWPSTASRRRSASKRSPRLARDAP